MADRDNRYPMTLILKVIPYAQNARYSAPGNTSKTNNFNNHINHLASILKIK